MRQAVGLLLNICFVPLILAGIWWQLSSAAFAYGRDRAHAVAEWIERRP